MTKYLLLYRSSGSAVDQMADATPEQAQTGMEQWMSWAGRVGDALVDTGAPTNSVGSVGAAPTADSFVGGYSILQADSFEALKMLVFVRGQENANRLTAAQYFNWLVSDHIDEIAEMCLEVSGIHLSHE